MSRLLPYPGLSIALGALWLLLHNSLAPLTLAGAALVGVAAPWALLPLQTPRPRIRNFGAIVQLAAAVLTDIVRSNVAVAAIILGAGRRDRVSRFVAVPLELHNRYGLAILAVIITSTPGTLWAQYDPARGRLLLHVLDVIDERTWIDLVKNRYERLLLEIFE